MLKQRIEEIKCNYITSVKDTGLQGQGTGEPVMTFVAFNFSFMLTFPYISRFQLM